MKTTKLTIRGRVQGVFFRVNTKKFADRINLKGTVQNQEDGSVLITTQGPIKKLEQLICWIKSNPGISKVNEIKEETQKTKEKFTEFKILKESSFIKDQRKALRNLKKKIF